MSNKVKALLIVAMLLLLITILLMKVPMQAKSKVFVYCGAGLKPAMDKIVKLFEKKYGVLVEISYGGIGAIASQFFASKMGDVFIVPDPLYFSKLREKGYVKSYSKILVFTPVIAFAKGNPKNITLLSDLLRSDVKVGLGDPRVPAIGRAAKEILERARIADAIYNKTVVYTSTVNELATYIKTGAIDAAIVWRAVAISYGLDYVEIDSKYNVEYPVYAVVLTTTSNEFLSEEFVKFLKTEDVKRIFVEEGFTSA